MLLEFQREMVNELIQNDGLLLTARGLGIERILSTFLHIHTIDKNLVILLNLNEYELLYFKNELETASQLLYTDADRISATNLKVVNNETPAKERQLLYHQGGVISVTSRILVVDLLNHVLPVEAVTGILIYHAENVIETSSMAFAIRLFRGMNKTGFIKAFSHTPEQFVGGITKLERMMKSLQIQTINLWPRFHVQVVENIESKGNVELIELRIAFSKRMADIQVSLLDCIHQTLIELKRMHPHIDFSELNIENSLFRSFDRIVRFELEPIWHNTSSKTKQLVEDLRTLRSLVHYLVNYDSVTFYTFLEAIRAANNLGKISGFKQNLYSWLLLDSANIVFTLARQRVMPNNSVNINSYIIEEPPKWKALIDVLDEIERQRAKLGESVVLIVTNEGIVAQQIRSLIDARTKSGKYSCDGAQKVLEKQLLSYLNSKSKTSGALESNKSISENNSARSKRRRIRGNDSNDQSDVVNSFGFPEYDPSHFKSEFEPSIQNLKSYIYVKAIGNEFNHQIDITSTFLESIRPVWLIIYNPNIEFVRRVEVFKSLNPDIKLQVFFMVYDNSIEEQQYLTSLRREKNAFEKLIHQKSSISIPIDEHGSIILDSEQSFWEKVDTRVAGGQNLASKVKKILVDVREFRSALPMELHSKKIEVIPCTLEVGDYILSPKICIERKSPSDLSQSLKSGRLYKQSQAMSAYEKPILLIEFPNPTSFCLNFSLYETEMDLPRRLALLVLHFPSQAILWSSSPDASAEMIQDLQSKEENPILEIAQSIGSDMVEKEGSFNLTVGEMLLDIPGINYKNWKIVMTKSKSLKGLANMNLVELQDMIGVENGRLVYQFFNSAF